MSPFEWKMAFVGKLLVDPESPCFDELLYQYLTWWSSLLSNFLATLYHFVPFFLRSCLLNQRSSRANWIICVSWLSFALISSAVEHFCYFLPAWITFANLSGLPPWFYSFVASMESISLSLKSFSSTEDESIPFAILVTEGEPPLKFWQRS